jgi:hypothetical protein
LQCQLSTPQLTYERLECLPRRRWTLRNQPHIGVAKALALYQLGSATADWVMWLVLADQNVFSTTLGQVLVIISIPTHYALGFLLVRAIRRASAAAALYRPRDAGGATPVGGSPA